MRDVATLLEALPYIREFHGKTVVIKYGGAAMTDPDAAARSSRATWCCSSTSGMNPVVVHGGGPDITRYMERLGMEVRVRRGPARVRRGHRRGGEDGAGRQAEQGHRAAHQPPRAAGGRAVRRRRPAVHRAASSWPAARPTSASWARSSAWTWTCCNHIAEDYIPVVASVGRRRRGQLLQRERRRRGGGRGRGARRVQGRLPDRRRGLARRPGRSRQPHLGGHRGGGARAAARGERRHAARSSRRACTRSSPASGNAHIVDGRQPHSLLLELFTDEGIGTKLWP